MTTEEVEKLIKLALAQERSSVVEISDRVTTIMKIMKMIERLPGKAVKILAPSQKQFILIKPKSFMLKEPGDFDNEGDLLTVKDKESEESMRSVLERILKEDRIVAVILAIAARGKATIKVEDIKG